MARDTRGTGSQFLNRKSELAKARLRNKLVFNDILIVEDEAMDADRLKATLRVMFGYDLELRRAATLGGAIDLFTSVSNTSQIAAVMSAGIAASSQGLRLPMTTIMKVRKMIEVGIKPSGSRATTGR